MAIISKYQLIERIEHLQKGKNSSMPLTSALCRSVGLPIITEGVEEYSKGLQTSCTTITTSSPAYWTSLAILDCSNTIVLGSSGANDNLHFYKDQCLDDALSYPRFQNIASAKFSAPVHSLGCYEETILVGSNKGVVRMIDTHGITNDTETIAPRQLAQYVPSDLNFDPIATPGIVTPNTQVKCVQFSRKYSFNPDECYPVNSLKFFMVVGSSAYVWDVEHEAEPIYTKKFGTHPLYNGHWSPHAPYSLIALASSDGGISIIDNRTSPSSTPAWSSPPGVPKIGVRDVKFSPIIPYWMASAGDDGVTQVWDIRFSHAVAKIDGHRKAVNSLAWANTHAEIICTASSDQTLKMWSLTPGSIPVQNAYDNFGDVEDEYSPKFICSGAIGVGQWTDKDPNLFFVGEDIEPCQSPIVQIRSSQHWRNLFYSVTRKGQLTAINVRLNTRESMAPHRYNEEKDAIAFEIEKDTFGRDIERALDNLDVLKSTPNKDERTLDIIRDIEELVSFTPAIDPGSWELGSLPKLDKQQARLWSLNDIQQVGVEAYEKDLTRWTRYIPPGITRKYVDQHLPKSIVKTVTEADQAIPEPIEEAAVTSARSSILNLALEDTLLTPQSTFSNGFFSASDQSDLDEARAEKPKHHHNPLKTGLKSLRRTMTLTKRKNKVHSKSTSTSDDETSTIATRQSTRRHGLY
ncbi:WD40-repeat-containing domain protein [Umbelopsis sp. PMI_123]|nr:WD40-repeat-containing domain protein [Umbelopsis sp. PMI_123]